MNANEAIFFTPKHLYRYEVCFASDVPFNCADGISKKLAFPVKKMKGA